jgi:thioredoxin reductase (NADPH)
VPTGLALPSEERFKNRGVSACAVCDGALPRFRNKPIVVVGGGDSAVEEATYLTKFASTVHLVHRRDQLRASKIMAQRAHDDPKIQIHFNSGLAEVLGDDAKGVTGVRLASTVDAGKETTLEATGVFLAIGHTPNTAFLDGQLELNPKKYVVWTKHFRTEIRAWRESSRRATWPTTTTVRRFRPPAPAACRPSTPNAGWQGQGVH